MQPVTVKVKVPCRVQVIRDPATRECRIEGVTDADRAEWRAKYGLTPEQLDTRLEQLCDHAAAVPKWYGERSRGGNWLATIRNWLGASQRPGAARSVYDKPLRDYGEG